MSTRVLALLAVAVLFGIAAGLGGYTFVYARGASYLTDDPAACANCHVMREQYDGWVKSSHRSVAVCNDCHTPHTFFAKYATKALNGYHHSRAFTSGEFHEPIQIKARNLDVTEKACRDCHRDVVGAIDHAGPTTEPISCVRCHDSVGHLR
jgi:cytochrome c nitrite reductase small subunit